MRGTYGRSVRGDVLEAVGLVNGTLTGQALVCYVGRGLGEGAEKGGLLVQPMGRAKGKAISGAFPGL